MDILRFENLTGTEAGFFVGKYKVELTVNADDYGNANAQHRDRMHIVENRGTFSIFIKVFICNEPLPFEQCYWAGKQTLARLEAKIFLHDLEFVFFTPLYSGEIGANRIAKLAKNRAHLPAESIEHHDLAKLRDFVDCVNTLV